MQRKSLAGRGCPVAETLEVVGEWWSLLIVRDVFRGIRRFDALQESLGIARNILTRRLKALIQSGILEKRAYEERPPRYEYRLTEKGRALFPVLIAMMEWGNRWAPPETPTVTLVDADTGRKVRPLLIDANTGAPLEPRKVRVT